MWPLSQRSAQSAVFRGSEAVKHKQCCLKLGFLASPHDKSVGSFQKVKNVSPSHITTDSLFLNTGVDRLVTESWWMTCFHPWNLHSIHRHSQFDPQKDKCVMFYVLLLAGNVGLFTRLRLYGDRYKPRNKQDGGRVKAAEGGADVGREAPQTAFKSRRCLWIIMIISKSILVWVT